MRYYLRKGTLIVRGDFRAASSGVDGGLKNVRTVLNISVPRNFSEDAAGYIDRISNRNGFLQPQFGLLTAVPITNLCIARYDYITVFVTAAVSDCNRTINIIVTSERPFTDSALLGAMMTVTEAKMQVISARKLPTGALSTDAVVVASEKTAGPPEEFAGPLTETGIRIMKAVSHALTEALVRFDNYLLMTWGVTRGWSRGNPAVKRSRPSFSIYSRYGGDHWNEWIPENCPYYPCHHYRDQQCSFCYCPLYPCMNTDLGRMIETPNGDIWSCMDCLLVHEPRIARHLLANPEAGIAELIALKKGII
ncbi:MAG: adenosylcobinamide amidohydrolase [Methanocorpusculum sp.]|nr:adenosylcobinamide amidohydrolase [Methanocorpusculum sp.]MDD3256642.1 cysteine-rich small domain-containing protein [Methanocorpusculum sp.]